MMLQSVFQTLVSSAKGIRCQTDLYRIQEAESRAPSLKQANGDLVLFRITDNRRSPSTHSTLKKFKEQVSYDLGRIARWETLQAESDLIEQYARENGMLAASIQHIW